LTKHNYSPCIRQILKAAVPSTLYLFLLAPSSFGAINIRGYVYDFAANKPVAGAQVWLKANKYISQTDSNGYFQITENSSATITRHMSTIPVSFQLHSSTITLALSELKTAVSIDVFSMNGRKINLFSNTLSAGTYHVYLQKMNLAPGSYIVNATVGRMTFNSKINILYNGTSISSFVTSSNKGLPENAICKTATTAAAWDTLIIGKEHYNFARQALLTSTDSIPKVTIKVNVPPALPSSLSPLENAEFYADSLMVAWYSSDPDGGTIHCNLYFGQTNPPPLFKSDVVFSRLYSATVTLPDGWKDETPYYWCAEVSDGIDSVRSAVSSVVHFTATPPVNLTWTLQNQKFYGDDLNDVFFLDSMTGWVADASNNILVRTDDGGINWKKLCDKSGQLKSVFFIDKQKGWACAALDTLLSTTDGGVTWTKKALGTVSSRPTLYRVRFSGMSKGWVVGSAGAIFTTTDGGVTWTAQTSPVYRILLDICLIDTLNGWIAGDTGTILKTIDGGST
jgi:hypothetical protein